MNREEKIDAIRKQKLFVPWDAAVFALAAVLIALSFLIAFAYEGREGDTFSVYYDNEVILDARACGYYPIQWSVDSLDWKDYGAEEIISRVCNHENLTGGAIILCHNGAKYTAKALDALLTSLKQQGYELIPISELIYTENYHIDGNGMQISDSKSQ